MESYDIGLIGIGLVGSALAERFVDVGYSVTGFDTEKNCLRALDALGAVPAASSIQVASVSRTIVLSLPDTNISRKVIDEVFDVLRPHQLVIDTTTGEPGAAVEFARKLAEQGVAFVDAAIAGSSAQIRQRTVNVLAGGTRSSIVAAQPLFQSFAERVFHLGPVGSGARMKLVNNLVLGLNRAVLAEGLAFAHAMELPLDRVLDVLKAGSTYSRVMDNKGLRMLRRDYPPEARLSQHAKDVRLIMDAAAKAGVSLPLSASHARLLAAAEELGFGMADNSAVFEAYLRTAPLA
jgi:3-hydroxyisobutyrate dehydrogenase-like beta-hydroxyacid dehydrogenase